MNRPISIAQLGEIMQMAYVPRDFEQALKFWTKTLGAGPFYSFEHVKLDRIRYRGQPVEIDFSIMLGYWGDMQIELVKQHNDAPSIFKTWHDEDRDGLHHVCMLFDDIDRARDLCNRAGLQVVQDALLPGGGEVVYVDCGSGPASLLEILKPAPGTAEFFGMREGHRTWVGSDPVRRVGRRRASFCNLKVRDGRWPMAYYLLASLKVKYGQQHKFNEVMRHLKPALEREGWKLIGAHQNTIGRLNSVVDLWEVSDLNAVTETLARVGRDKEFGEWAAQLPNLVDEEVLQLMSKLPYSP